MSKVRQNLKTKLHVGTLTTQAVQEHFEKLIKIKEVYNIPAFSYGWNSPVGSWSQPRVILENGWVTLQGMLTGGTDNRMFTLPQRFRPNKTHSFAIVQAANVEAIQINSDGVVSLISSVASRINVHLDGVRYYIGYNS